MDGSRDYVRAGNLTRLSWDALERTNADGDRGVGFIRDGSFRLPAQGCRHVGQGGVGYDERVLELGVVVVDQLGPAAAGKHGHGEDLLHGRVEAQESDHVSAGQVNDADAASALVFLEAFGDRDAAEDRAFAHLRQPDERQAPGEVETASETGGLGNRLVAAGIRVDVAQRSRADSQTQSRSPCHRGEWGMESPRVITSPVVTSIRMPPLALFARHAPIWSVSPSAVT